MRQAESRLSTKILAHLRERFGTDIFVFKVHGNEHMMAGLPDIVGCVGGRFFGIETKMQGKEGNTSKRQDYVHALMQDAGAKVAICSTADQAIQFVHRVATVIGDYE